MNRDPRVDAYIAKAAPFAWPILEYVRDRVAALVPAAEETLKWSAPAYTLEGRILLVLAAFKNHAAVNFWRGAEVAGGKAKPGAMGQLGKLTSLDDLPDDLDAMITEAAALSASAPAPRKAKAAPKAASALHPEFEAALAANAPAKATLDAFPPGQRREYLDWINDSKQDATRAKRIATAVEWLAEGKKCNWKYEKC